MRIGFLFIISLFSAIFGDFTKKQLSVWYGNDSFCRQLFSTVAFGVGAITLYVIGDVNLTTVSLFTWCTGILFGLVTGLYTIVHMKALDSGPLAYTAVIISLSTLIPTFSGAVFWNEKVFPIQFLGIFFMIICFVLSVNFQEKQSSRSIQWLIYCGLGFLLNGAVGTMQKWHQNSPYKGELDTFIFISFLCAAVYCLILLLPSIKQEKHSLKIYLSRRFVLLSIFAGISFGIVNNLNLYLVGMMDSAVFFPTFNISALILNTLSSIILFKESPTRRQFLGLLIGMAAVFCLCNPFS